MTNDQCPPKINTPPTAPVHWGLPTLKVPTTVQTTETIHSEDPLPKDIANQTIDSATVQNDSVELSEEGSPYLASSNKTMESELPPQPITNVGYSRGTDTMPNVWYRNLRPISTPENAELQDKINHISPRALTNWSQVVADLWVNLSYSSTLSTGQRGMKINHFETDTKHWLLDLNL